MDLAVAGTAVIAIRTGSANLEALVVQLNYLYEESLFVADLERLCQEADRRLIPDTGRKLPARVDAVRFENVSFTYPGTATEPALDGVNVTIPTGRIVALVGNNGSGKSTLAKLLCGLYAPDAGRILWDGIDSTELDRTDLFDRVAVVAQDFYRWPFTARVNIAIGRPDAPHEDEHLHAAAEYAGADETIAGLPRGGTPSSPAGTRAATRSPAASGSASASPAPGTATPASSSWTNRPVPWTRRPSSASSTRSGASPPEGRRSS